MISIVADATNSNGPPVFPWTKVHGYRQPIAPRLSQSSAHRSAMIPIFGHRVAISLMVAVRFNAREQGNVMARVA